MITYIDSTIAYINDYLSELADIPSNWLDLTVQHYLKVPYL